MNCPHCNKDAYVCITEKAFLNCENYGSNSFQLLCRKCGKPITVYIERFVKLRSIEKGNHKQDSFGYIQN